ncbi:MAG: type II toxin-antitoxin system RelE/ParE family toxin [Bacteroidia bacterium]
MSYSIIYTPEFEKQLKRLCKKYKSLPKDLSALVAELKVKPESGTPLGHNCYKIRLAISSKGKGKSGGARVITFVILTEKEIYLISIYDKSEQESISDKDISVIRKQIKPKK